MAKVDFSDVKALAEMDPHDIEAAVKEYENEADAADPAVAEVTAAPSVETSGAVSGEGGDEPVAGSDSPAAPESEAGPEAPESSQRALHGIRNDLIETRRRESELKQRVAYYEGLLAAQQAQAQATVEEEPADPFERQERLISRLEAKVDAQSQAQAFTIQQQQQAQVSQAVAGAITQQTAEFKAQHPDYDQAAQHVIRVKAAEYAANGLDNPEARALSDIAYSAFARVREGGNAPQGMYEYAKILGYQTRQVPQQAAQRLQQRPISLSQIPASSPANTTARGIFDPSELIRKNPSELERLSLPENAHELEKLMREREAGIRS